MNIKQEFKKLTKRKRKKVKYSNKKSAKLRRSKKAKNRFKKKYVDYLKSREWAEIRIDLFSLRGRFCEKCGSCENLQIHHLRYRNVFNEEPEDLVILCEPCHKNEHRFH